MKIYPAIDLLDGKCVRLYKGDFDQSTEYADDPIAVAASFRAQGADTLHLVDLSGAKNPEQRQTSLIEDIIRETDMDVQCGGGIRTSSDVQSLLNAGVKRAVIGSVAVKNPKLMQSMLASFGGHRICVAIDVKPCDKLGYAAATSGWQRTSKKSLDDIIAQYIDHGLAHILCTDIEHDGTLEGPNMPLYTKLAAQYPDLKIQASGGVASMDDLLALADLGIHAAITGKAIYENKFTVAQAIDGLKDSAAIKILNQGTA